MSDPELQRLSRGMVQVNLRLSKLLSLAERQEAGPSAGAVDFELLFDLVESVERTLALPVPKRPWWAWGPQPVFELSGLRLALEQTLARMAAQGVAPVPTQGRPDPRLHQVIEVVSGSAGAPGEIAHTHRRGWTGPDGAPLRTAQVSVYKQEET